MFAKFVFMFIQWLLLCEAARTKLNEAARTRLNFTLPDSQKFNGLGKGYDVLLGNPMEARDPGLTTVNVFDLTFDSGNEEFVDGQRFQVPDKVNLMAQDSCNSRFSSQAITSGESYKQSLSSSVSVDVNPALPSLGKAKFGASFGFNSTVAATKHSVFIHSKTSCTAYRVGLDIYRTPQLSAGFRAAVNSLSPLGTEPDRTYWNFIDTYGTHVVKDVQMGCEAMWEFRMEKNTFNSNRQFNMNTL